jgi:hypothetical protein
VQCAGWQPIALAGDAQRQQDQGDGRRHGEAEPGGQRTAVAGVRQPQRHAHLTARRSGQELAERHQIGILDLAQPAAFPDELLLQEAQMRHRPTEGDAAQLQEGQEDAERAPVRLPHHCDHDVMPTGYARMGSTGRATA